MFERLAEALLRRENLQGAELGRAPEGDIRAEDHAGHAPIVGVDQIVKWAELAVTGPD